VQLTTAAAFPAGAFESYSRGRGNIQPSQVHEIWGLAEKHGFALAPFFNDQGLCGDRIAALKAERVAEADTGAAIRVVQGLCERQVRWREMESDEREPCEAPASSPAGGEPVLSTT
jgi:hypothetical protein